MKTVYIIIIIDLSVPCDIHTRATWPHVALYNIYNTPKDLYMFVYTYIQYELYPPL